MKEVFFFSISLERDEQFLREDPCTIRASIKYLSFQNSYRRLVSCDDGWRRGGETGYIRKVAIVLAKSGKGNRSPPPATLG